ncbi:ABC transporter ATP-binding protein, partial [Rhodopseudomonas sp. BR0C11]|nr:ABC transporter ATP-binding protein [Rhodopseudomonas sp. BR0C11]
FNRLRRSITQQLTSHVGAGRKVAATADS